MAVGIGLAESAFQVHGVDRGGRVVLRRRLGHGRLPDFCAKLPSCRIGLEACASTHLRARRLTARSGTMSG